MRQSNIRSTSRRAQSLMLAAFVFSASSAITVAAPPTPPSTTQLDPVVAIDQAQSHLETGHIVKARDLLIQALGSQERVTLSDTQRTHAYQLLADAVLALQSLDRSEVTLQEAELAIERHQLVSAEQLLQSLLRDAAAQEIEPPARADDLLKRIASIQSDLSTNAASILDNASTEFSAGRFAAARTKIAELDALGDVLTAEQVSRRESIRSRLADLSALSPQSLLASASPAAMQTEVKRRDNAQPDDDTSADPSVDLIEEPAPITPPASIPDEDLIRQVRQFEAQSLFAETNADFTNRRLSSAEQGYARLLTVYRTFLSGAQIEEAQSKLDETRILLQTERRGERVLDDTIRQRELAKQQTLAEFNNEIDQSQRALAGGDYQSARDLAFQARQTAIAARDLFAESDFENLTNRIITLLNSIDIREQEILALARQGQATELIKTQKDAEERRRRERDQQIAEAIDRVRALQAELKYSEALQVVDQILFLDPINPIGLLLRDVLEDNMAFQQYRDLGVKAQKGYMQEAVNNREAQIPPEGLVGYPTDWPALSHTRIGGLDSYESPENRRILSQLNERRVPVAFRDNTFAQVIDFVEAVTSLDVDVDWDSLEEISIDRDTPINLTLNNAPMRVVLNRVIEKVSAAGFGESADWAVIDGVLTISSDSNIRLNTTLEIYDIRDLVVDIPVYDEAPNLDLNTALRSGQGGGGRSPFRATQVQDADRIPLEERIDNMIDIITTNVDFEGWEDNGGDTGRIQQLNGTLIVTNTPKNHRSIRSLLSKLRAAQALQINVESRFLLVSQSFFEQIGFDLDVYLNAENNQIDTAQIADPTVSAADFFNFNTAPIGVQNQVGGGQTVFATDTNGNIVFDQNNQPVTFQTLGVGTVAPEQFSPTSFAQNSFGLTTSLAPQAGIAATILGANPALGIAGQFLDDIQVDFLVQATQADTRGVTLTAPRITFTNGQTSNVFVATQQTFVSDLTPVVSDSAVGFDPTLQVVTEGVVLLVTGTVSADRRYVTLDLTTGVSQIESFGQQPITAVAGGQLVSSADTSSFIQLPRVRVTNISTTVTVPDQGTVLLGGQRIISENEVETGVPVLSKLPIINRFFSNRIEVKEESTLLILVKPTILIQNEQEERNFPGLLDSLGLGLGN